MNGSRSFVLAVSIVCCAANAYAGLDGQVYLMPIEGDSFASYGEAAFVNATGGTDIYAHLTGTHSVHGPQVFEVAVNRTGVYRYTLEGPAEPSACYGSTLHVVGDPSQPGSSDEETWTSPTRCAPPPDPGGTGCGTNGGICEQSESCPLILDLNNDGIHTTGLDDPVHFWIDRQGRTEATAWTNPSTEEAFLWIDLNRDRTAQVTELFGSRMIASNGAYHANGFDALVKYDRLYYGGNGDGQITHKDWVWSRLELWVDRNHDAVSQPTEISVLRSHRIVALDLAYTEGDVYDEHGNELYLLSNYIVRGPGGETELQMMADVEFQYIAN